MSLKHYDHRKPHLTSAFEILEADFEMQEEDEYQRYYKYWHDDPEYDDDTSSYWAYELQNENIAEDLLGELYPLYTELKESFCDEERFSISYDFNKRINFRDYKFSEPLSISYGFEYANAPCKKYYVSYNDLDYKIYPNSEVICMNAGSIVIGNYILNPYSSYEVKYKEFDKQEEVIEFVNKWMRSHVIALQKAKLRLIGMQDDED